MGKRWLFLLLLFILAGIGSLPWWITSQQLEQLANYFLAPGYTLQIGNERSLNMDGLQVSQLRLGATQCNLVTLNNIQLNWWAPRRLEVEQATLDYACLNSLHINDNGKTSPKLTALFSSLPTAEVVIKHLKVLNTENVTQPLLNQLITADLSVVANYEGKRLQINTEATEEATKNGTLILQHRSTLTPQNGQFHWQGRTDFQPTEKQAYHLTFSTKMNNELLRLKPRGEITLNWQNPEFVVAKGEIKWTWDGEKGQINAQDLVRSEPLLDVPFILTPNSLEVSWGTFYWTFDGYQPVKGFLGLTLRKPQDNWFPLNIDLDVILQTFGEQGKGEIVFAGKGGQIGGGTQQNELNFDLKTRGDLRYNNTVAQTNLDYHIGGTFSDPILQFRPGSIFKMDNLQPDAKIHVRLPLDDVLIGRYGLEGRLQATLQGFIPQFENLNLKLDGQAHEFIAGIKTVFELRDEQQNLHNAEMRAANRWDWTISGSAQWKALKTAVTMQGIGFWQANYIELNQLSAHSGNVYTGGVKMAPLSLELKDRLRWNYEKEHIRGLMQAKTDWIEFDYGGWFVKPVFGVGLNGKSINHFTIAGELKAGSLGPLDLTARYQNQTLTGQIGWKEQSANVFQSLFPQQWEWIIHQGTIKGASNFVINGDGVALHGELNLRCGEITMPDGEIQGLNIRFPLNYQDLALKASRNKPIRVSANNIRKGALLMNKAVFNLFGTYPNSAKSPLTLSNARINVFDGELQIPSLSFPQQKIATLSFKNIDLAQVINMAQYNQISLRGRVNATLPFWLGHQECLICNGTIEQVNNLHIKLNDEIVTGLKKGGWTENILVDLLKEMELEKSRANLNLAPDGQMKLHSSLTAFNPTKRTRSPITLNYTHQENMFELWNMIDYGSQFEQNLQYRLYRHLEQ
ncbi:YdbH family protein [Aggregatibacter actinomycetemcomitans]|uniref:YdbH family protein n=1 Tax=Aggregatibacter actinomycetemcomitans TaxID=714 RepID=UPI0011D94FFE|nr:YdbH family protein [Aggregatibacter actinomycetemcomitans]TYA99155.1 YdbH family protein [Aggregatibacter actinomycetemcomitans]